MSARDRLARREREAAQTTDVNEPVRGDWKTAANRDVAALATARTRDVVEARQRTESELTIVNDWMRRFPRDEILGQVRSMPIEKWMRAAQEQRAQILRDIQELEQQEQQKPERIITVRQW